MKISTLFFIVISTISIAAFGMRRSIRTFGRTNIAFGSKITAQSSSTVLFPQATANTCLMGAYVSQRKRLYETTGSSSSGSKSSREELMQLAKELYEIENNTNRLRMWEQSLSKREQALKNKENFASRNSSSYQAQEPANGSGEASSDMARNRPAQEKADKIKNFKEALKHASGELAGLGIMFGGIYVIETVISFFMK